MANAHYPTWMLDNPDPEDHMRILSGYPMYGWLGVVQLENIEYWVDNRRTDRQLTQLKNSIHTVPNSDMLYDALKDDPELEIERLARDIIKNQLREPIILSYDKVLLDGNRQYLAHRWISTRGTPQERAQFS